MIDLEQVTEEYLEEGLSAPADMADRALDEYDFSELVDILKSGLTGVFRHQIHNRRAKLFRHSNGKSARLSAAQVAYRIFIQPEPVGEVLKPLGKCTWEDIIISEESYRKRANNETREADRRKELAKLMKRKRVKLVEDLNANDVLEVMAS